MSTPLNPATESFWRQYLDAAPDASSARRWFYEAFRIGTTADSADVGALLITRGIKTATSSLLWEYEALHKPLPQVGSLSILENGRDEPVCVVETTELLTRPFREIDELFAAKPNRCNGFSLSLRLNIPDYSVLVLTPELA